MKFIIGLMMGLLIDIIIDLNIAGGLMMDGSKDSDSSNLDSLKTYQEKRDFGESAKR